LKQQSITDSVAESNAVELRVDEGIGDYSPEERANIDIHAAALRHRKKISKRHNSLENRRKPCPSCGRLVCRCSDRLRREQIEGAEGMK
jgi:hypothetical protein